MGDRSAIEWTDATWNPVTGCSKVSPGCAYCYAETLSVRFGWSRKPWTPDNAAENIVLHSERLDQPLRWHEPRMVFVNSMSDLFHELVPDDFIRRVWMRMEVAQEHTFQVLTKRPGRMRDLSWSLPLLPNVWLGTSIENDRWVPRADDLLATRAAVRFISAEPLLGDLGTLDIAGIDWLIVGGESAGPPTRALVRPAGRPFRIEGGGQLARQPMIEPKPEALAWVRSLRDRAIQAGTAFFFKQWGGRTPKAGGRQLDGRTWDEMPLTRLSLPCGDAQPQLRWAVKAVPRDGLGEAGSERESGFGDGIAVEA